MAGDEDQDVVGTTQRPALRWWSGLGRHRQVAAAVVGGTVVIAGLMALTAAVGGGDGQRRTTLRTGDDPAQAFAEADDITTTSVSVDVVTTLTLPVVAPSTAPPPPPPTTATPGPQRRTLITSAEGGWTLRAVDDGRGCVELEAAGHTYGRLLCGVKPAAGVVGDLVTVDVGGSHFLVAVVADGVTGFSGYPRAAGAIQNDTGRSGADPTRPGLVYLAGFAAVRSHPRVDVLVRGGEDTLARVVVPGELATFGAGSYELHTAPPYGRRPGYRYGGSSGLFGGGIQEIGFYDGFGGRTCVLYRRLGPGDRTFLDACPPRADDAIAHAVVAPDAGPSATSTQPVVVLDGAVTGWGCSFPGGERCNVNALVVADPRGTARSLGVPLTSWLDTGPHREVTFTAMDGSKEVGRLTVPVDGGGTGSSNDAGPTTTSPTSTTTGG